jgi:hypothetical protein
MKGQFEVTQDMIDYFKGDIGKLTNHMIALMLNNPYHNVGWFARKEREGYHNAIYMFDERFGDKITDKNYIKYLLALKDEGYELAYDIVPNS